MPPLQIKIINHSSNPLPSYQTVFSAGMDLYAFLEKPVLLKPFERFLVPTGIILEIPEGYEGQVRPRSGLAYKNGVTVLNSPGTIDSDYRGEIKVLLINLSEENFFVTNGMRIAQLLISPYVRTTWEQVDSLSETQRGTGGYGSTGV